MFEAWLTDSWGSFAGIQVSLAENEGCFESWSGSVESCLTALKAPRFTSAPALDLWVVLQCVAVCCSVLQCVAVYCSVLECVGVSWSVLECSAV